MDDPYKILGVHRDASAEEIKRAFRRLSHQHHPDKGGDAAKFKELNRAYQILSDPEKRAQYDRFGAAGFSQGGAGGHGGGNGFDFSRGFGRGFSDERFEFNFGGGLNDLFGDIFGAAFAHVQAEVQISPAQAVLGDELSLRVGDETVKLTVPPGTQNGQVFTFRGRGRLHRRGRGDLSIVVRVVFPRRLSRRERALWEELRRLSS